MDDGETAEGVEFGDLGGGGVDDGETAEGVEFGDGDVLAI